MRISAAPIVFSLLLFLAWQTSQPQAWTQSDQTHRLEPGLTPLPATDAGKEYNLVIAITDAGFYRLETLESESRWSIDDGPFMADLSLYLSPGEYSARVRDLASNTDDAYRWIAITPEWMIADEEPNDTAELANPATLGDTRTVTIENAYDVDWLQFTSPDMGEYLISVWSRDGSPLGDIEVLRPGETGPVQYEERIIPGSGGYVLGPYTTEPNEVLRIGFRIPDQRTLSFDVTVHFVPHADGERPLADREIELPIFIVGIGLDTPSSEQMRLLTDALGGAYVPVDHTEELVSLAEEIREVTEDNFVPARPGFFASNWPALLIVLLGVGIAGIFWIRRRRSE
ncbi:hypothetical protein [Hyphobacterium sp.]|uniref:hypothetical protein n=1 Tax=Hyphobacterium sp. TaxID=2004662 RepID=UPI003BAD4062